MKPKDLKSPYSWEKRELLVRDRLFFLPTYLSYEGFTFPSWDDSALFGKQQPISLEFCSGNGEWVVAKAEEERGRNWVAVERRFDRVRKIWSKRTNRLLDNLFIVCGEAFAFAHHFVPAGSIDEVFINFPDPWPKRREAKHRLCKPPFMAELARILKPEGSVTLVTDDLPYLEESHGYLLNEGHFCALETLVNQAGYGTSYFEELWKSKGRTIYTLKGVRQ